MARPRGNSDVVQIHPGTKVLFVVTDPPWDIADDDVGDIYFSGRRAEKGLPRVFPEPTARFAE